MLTTAQAAKVIGVSKSTLLRWIADGRIADAGRDGRGWRVWSQSDLHRLRRFKRVFHLEGHGSAATRGFLPLDAISNRATVLATFRRVVRGSRGSRGR